MTNEATHEDTCQLSEHYVPELDYVSFKKYRLMFPDRAKICLQVCLLKIHHNYLDEKQK